MRLDDPKRTDRVMPIGVCPVTGEVQWRQWPHSTVAIYAPVVADWPVELVRLDSSQENRNG